jgi:quercetin dioxygenase-like cupin family protein
MTPYIIELDEDHDAPPTYQHAGEEMIFVLAGELKYAAGGRLHHLRKGDTLIFDATIQHGPIKLPGKKASYLAVFAGEPGFQSTSPNRRGRKKVS